MKKSLPPPPDKNFSDKISAMLEIVIMGTLILASIIAIVQLFK